jgi:hypothetical protein
MATEAQINANRQNAQQSTGPVTEQGKAAVSQNALKHGLFAVQDVLTTEIQQEFDLLHEQMLAQLAPAGAVESMLAQRAISLAWRLKRAETMQSQIIEEKLDVHIGLQRLSLGRKTPKDPSDEPEYVALGRVAKKDWCGERLIERLFEYERRIEKSLFKTMAEFRAMQAVRLAAQADAATHHRTDVDDEANSEEQSQNPAVAGNPNHETRNPTDAEQNSAKQSQSVKTESSSEKLPDRFEKWPDTYGIDPKELTSFLKKTYGDRYPEMVKVILNRHSGSQAQNGGNGQGLPLSLSRT